MPTKNLTTVHTARAAYLRTLSGANKSAATIRAYRIDLARFLTFLRETNCTFDAVADITRASVDEYLTWPGLERHAPGIP